MTLDTLRDTRLREGMAAAGLDAVLAWRTEEVVLTTGVCPHLGMTLCLYPRTGDPVVYAMALEQADTLPDHLPVRRYMPGAGSGFTPWADLRAMLWEDAARLNVQRIGCAPEAGRHALPGNSAESPPLSAPVIAYLLADLEAVPVDFFPVQMMIKTPQEVERIRRTNMLAGIGLRAFYDGLAPGQTEVTIAGQVEAAIQAASGQHGSQLARAWAFVQGGPNSALAGTVSRSSAYALQPGDLVVLEMATWVDGYWSDLTRTGVVGEPNPAQTALITAVQDAQRAALDTVRAGVTHAAVDAVARAVLDQRGYGAGFTHATGHHVGLRYHDHGPMLAVGSDAPLQAGMVITVEPGVYGAAFGGGVRFEDNVLVTSDGYEMLSPHDLTG
jgi:Xaa-Pro dipeptidase